eukprot:jgi/Mesen1/2549/ME000162S01678
MASITMSSIGAIAAAPAAALAASSSSKSSSVQAFTGLKQISLTASTNEWASKTTSNSSRVSCMKVWTPNDNLKFETLSYLPPLTAEQILKEVDYLISNGWIPAIEFDKVGTVSKDNFQGSCYYDGRYWTMWKLPMFGCKDSAAVLREVEEAKKTFPQAFIRIIGFDNKRQVQCVSFIVHKPY